MKKYIFTLILLLVASLTAAQSPKDLRFPTLEFDPPEVERFTLDNGIVVHFLENHDLPVVTATALFKGGAVQDPENKSGLASLTARLIRSGGAGVMSPEQLDDTLDFIAASISSGNDEEYMTIDMNTLKKNADNIFNIYCSVISQPLFDSAKMELEISNKKEQIRRQNDHPGDVTRRVYYETVFSGHPYGYYPTLTSIDNITRNDILNYYNHFYAPDNCILAISGDLTMPELKSILASTFAEWEGQSKAINVPPRVEASYEPGVYYAERDINQAHIRFGHLCMDTKNPDRYAMEIVNFAMGGGGFISRMTGQVRTTAGLAYSVGTYVYNRPYRGTLFAYCQTKAESMSAAIDMMLEIMRNVKENGITAEEMETAHESIINGYVFNYDTPAKYVKQKAFLELMDFPADQMQIDLDAFQKVTLEDCNRVAAKYIEPDKLAFVITGNKKLFDKPLSTYGPVHEVSMDIK